MPWLQGTQKHKEPPMPEFYGLIQWMAEWGGRRIFAHGFSRGAMWLEHAILERPQCLEAVFLAGSETDFFR
jgi:hypothetical protein